MNYIELVNLEILLRQLGLFELKEYRSRYKGRCPSKDHMDNTPSWSIYKDTGHHKCFSCGFEGSLNHLIKYITSKDIFKFLNINEPENFLFKKSLEDFKIRNSFENKSYGVKQQLGNVYSIDDKSNHLWEDVDRYIKKREIDQSFIDFYNIKWCVQNVINDTIFENRILIPIVEHGQILSIEGRTFLDEEPKVIYPKRCTINTLFNLDNLNFSEPIILVEGIMDLHKIWTHITKNITCIFGATLSSNQEDIISSIPNLIVIPDNDKASENMLVAIDNIREDEWEIALLDKNIKDPGDASIIELKEALNNKISAVKYFMNKNDILINKNLKW